MSVHLPSIINTGLPWLPERPRIRRAVTDHIQIHHTVGNYGTRERWLDLHLRNQEKGNRGVPYSFLVLENGDVFVGRGADYGHGGVRDDVTNRANQRSIAIALNGDMREQGKPTPEQLASAANLAAYYVQQYKLSYTKVIGHNEVPTFIKDTNTPTGKYYATACPVIDMNNFRRLVADAIALPDVPIVNPEQPQPLVYPYRCVYGGDTRVNVRDTDGNVIAKYPDQDRQERAAVLEITNGRAKILLYTRTPMIMGYCISENLTPVKE